jgi:hypothetical protein
MSFAFSPAVREQSKARIALCGPSGAGKTYTGLTVATAMGDPVAVIDTEHGSAARYARGKDGQGWEFDHLAMTSFEPLALVEALATAAEQRYPVVLVDSLSPFWSGPGGMLEQADAGARRFGGNNFAGWKEARPMERQLIEAMLAYPGHVIATMRSKTEYVIEEDDRGRKTPRKVGMRPEQKDGIEYEFDIVGDLDWGHVLTVSKTRCSVLADSVIAKPGAELATTVLEWLSGGAEVRDPASFIDQARDLASFTDAQELYAELTARLLLYTPMLHPLSGRPITLGTYVIERGHELRSAEAGAAAASPTASADPAA